MKDPEIFTSHVLDEFKRLQKLYLGCVPDTKLPLAVMALINILYQEGGGDK